MKQKAAWVMALLLHFTPAIAQSTHEDIPNINGCKADEVVRFRGGTARLENDLFVGTDQNYTNGIAFTAVSYDIAGKIKTECMPLPIRLHAEFIKYLNPDFWRDEGNPAHTQNVVVKFGQSMFTPQDRTRTDLITGDRPYAGLLYVGLSWNRRKHEPEATSEILDTRELTLGVIGPWSFAEQSQNLVHDAIGSERFNGWQNQLKNEPALQMAMERKFRDYSGAGAIIPGFSADTIRSLGVRLGNIETSATVGVEGRVGWNLPNDFGSYPIRPGAENRPPSTVSLHSQSNDARPEVVRPRPGIHLFGMLEPKFVAHDFSLDGNLFQSSHSVVRRQWVIQAAVGVSVQSLAADHGFRLAVMRVYRLQEYEGQEVNQGYGSVAMSIEF